jgi:hypothetical protein
MKRIQLAALAAVFVLAPMGIVACGGDDSSQDEDDITAAIDRAATSGEAAACTEVQTQKFIEQTGDGSTGAAAIKQCEKDAADTPADEVDVTNIEVDGDKATADAAVTGSFFDGQTLELALVKDGDQWKLDEFTGFAKFDRDAMAAAVIGEIAKDPNTPAEAVACIKKQFEAGSDQELEAVFLGTDKSAEDKFFGPCFKGE